MEVAGVVLAGVATADLCFKYGKILLEICASFREAHTEVAERVISVKSHWKRISIQLDFTMRIWESLDDEHQDVQAQVLQVLVNKLTIITSKLNTISKKGSDQFIVVRRWNYILIKQCLDRAIEDLVSWQNKFDPSWFLTMKISSPLIDRELSKGASTTSALPIANSLRDALKEGSTQNFPVFLPKDGLDFDSKREVPFTATCCVRRVNSDKTFVVDRVSCGPEADATSLVKDVRELARKLSSTDPVAFGILKCRGVIRNDDSDSRRPLSFDFIFQIPEGFSSEPRSLRSYLCSPASHTLTNRVQLANQLAKSICYVHTLGFVHKNFRPETILGFPGNQASSDSFFLVGFEKIRAADGRTLKAGDSSWEKNLYRHPHRQGLHPEEIYTMQHDIYSLGVCLLEVGLWDSFLVYANGANTPVPSATLRPVLDTAGPKTPTLLKDHLVNLARRSLPKRMGERYTEVVVNCLTCLDKDNTDFGNQAEFEDADGVLVGVRYIGKILMKLDEILV